MACLATSVSLLVILVISDTCQCASMRDTVQLTVTTDKQRSLPTLNNGVIQARSRRKASPVNADTSPPIAYMMQLRDSLTDSGGAPRTASDDPTNVWCLLDKGIIMHEE